MDNRHKKKKSTYYNIRKWTKLDKILHISGWIMAGIQAVATTVFGHFMKGLGFLPAAYEMLIMILLFLFALITLIAQHWKIPGIITKVTSVVISIVLVVGSVYIKTTDNFFDKATSRTQQTEMCVYVLNEDEAESITELADEEFAYAKVQEKYADAAFVSIGKAVGKTVLTKEYPDVTALIDALYAGDTRVIVMNKSSLDIIEDSYESFEDDVKCIETYTIVTEYVQDTNEDYLAADEVITFYISGIDTVGAPTVNRNSDVNIILTMNTKTHQILMINTPRDFYVNTTESVANNGIPDKLTHAGGYGIECSVGTLQMLYGINIDYYVKVNFTGFVEIINQLGGIDVYSEYDFITRHGKDHIVVGNNHLTGEQALGFARERYSFATGDKQRGKNQMAVIKAMIEKMATTDMLMNYTNVLDAVSNSLVTSMPREDINRLVQMQLEEMPTWDIQTYSVDGTGDSRASYSLASPHYVMIPDENTVNQAKAYLMAMYNNQLIDTTQQ